MHRDHLPRLGFGCLWQLCKLLHRHRQLLLAALGFFKRSQEHGPFGGQQKIRVALQGDHVLNPFRSLFNLLSVVLSLHGQPPHRGNLKVGSQTSRQLRSDPVLSCNQATQSAAMNSNGFRHLTGIEPKRSHEVIGEDLSWVLYHGFDLRKLSVSIYVAHYATQSKFKAKKPIKSPKTTEKRRPAGNHQRACLALFLCRCLVIWPIPSHNPYAHTAPSHGRTCLHHQVHGTTHAQRNPQEALQAL